LDKISIFSSLLPLAVLLFFNKEKMTFPLKVILVYVIYSFLNDIALKAAYGVKNSQLAELLLRIFTAVEYSIFAFFFYLVVKSPIFKKIIIGHSIVFFSITFYNYINNPNASFDSIPVSTESILIIIYCLYYFYESINQPQLTFLYSAYHFWVVIGILIYLSGAFFLFTQADKFSRQDTLTYWVIAYMVNILKNIFFSIAFYIKKNPSKNPLRKNPTIS